jgi:putative sterol carrier protein
MRRSGREERVTVTDSTAEFFAELGQRGQEPLLSKMRGRARIDVVDGKRTQRWLLTVDKGSLVVSKENAAADCVIRVDRTLFDRIVTGRQNAVAAVLRGDLEVAGDWRFLVLLQRLFPSPPRPRHRRQTARSDA